jgi:hypothetical protein
VPGTKVGLRIDQTLTQDATGMVMLAGGAAITVHIRTGTCSYLTRHRLSPRLVTPVVAGGQIPAAATAAVARTRKGIRS